MSQQYTTIHSLTRPTYCNQSTHGCHHGDSAVLQLNRSTSLERSHVAIGSKANGVPESDGSLDTQLVLKGAQSNLAVWENALQKQGQAMDPSWCDSVAPWGISERHTNSLLVFNGVAYELHSETSKKDGKHELMPEAAFINMISNSKINQHDNMFLR